MAYEGKPKLGKTTQIECEVCVCVFYDFLHSWVVEQWHGNPKLL